MKCSMDGLWAPCRALLDPIRKEWVQDGVDKGQGKSSVRSNLPVDLHKSKGFLGSLASSLSVKFFMVLLSGRQRPETFSLNLFLTGKLLRWAASFVEVKFSRRSSGSRKQAWM